MLYTDIEFELREQLNAGERLLWTGIPKQGVTFSSSDKFLIPFSLVWGGFAIFWETTSIVMGAPFFFSLFGVPFVLIGLYLIVGRFFADARRRKYTFYGLTNTRILIKSGAKTKTIKSLNIKALSDITLNENADGSGTIYLSGEGNYLPMGRNTSWPGMASKAPAALEMITDVRSVYKQITDLQRAE